MFQGFPGLHDTDDGGLYQQLPVLLDVLVCQLHLLLLLSFHGDVDVDAELLVLVLMVQLDHRRALQVGVTLSRTGAGPRGPWRRSRGFIFQLQQLRFEQNLEDLHQDLLLDLGALGQLLQGPLVGLVVLQEDGKLERRGLKRVTAKETTKTSLENEEVNFGLYVYD